MLNEHNVLVPEAGALPVAVQPMQTYCVLPRLIGDATLALMKLFQICVETPEGVGEPRGLLTVSTCVICAKLAVTDIAFVAIRLSGLLVDVIPPVQPLK